MESANDFGFLDFILRASNRKLNPLRVAGRKEREFSLRKTLLINNISNAAERRMIDDVAYGVNYGAASQEETLQALALSQDIQQQIEQQQQQQQQKEQGLDYIPYDENNDPFRYMVEGNIKLNYEDDLQPYVTYNDTITGDDNEQELQSPSLVASGSAVNYLSDTCLFSASLIDDDNQDTNTISQASTSADTQCSFNSDANSSILGKRKRKFTSDEATSRKAQRTTHFAPTCCADDPDNLVHASAHATTVYTNHENSIPSVLSKRSSNDKFYYSEIQAEMVFDALYKYSLRVHPF